MFKDSVITFSTRIFVFCVGIANTIIIARVLGPTLKGSLGLTTLILSVGVMLVLFGQGSAIVYHGASDPEKLPYLAGNSIIAAIVLGLIGIVTVESLLFMPPFQRYLLENGVQILWVRWLILLLPFMLAGTYLQEVVRAAGKIGIYSAFNIIAITTNLLGIVIFVWVLDYQVPGALLTVVLTHLIKTVIILTVALDSIQFRPKVDVQIFRKSFSYGMRLYPGNLAQFLNYRLDIFIIAIFLNPTAVGYYTTATGMAEKIWFIPNSLQTILLHRIARLDGTTASVDLTMRVARLLFLAIGCICLALLFLSYPIVLMLYGVEYVPSVAAFVALIPGIWFFSVGKVLAVHMSGSGRPIVGTYAAVSALLTTVVLDFLLIPQIGIVGASIASSVSYITSTLLLLFYFVKETQAQVRSVLIPTRGDMLLLQQLIQKGLGRRFPSVVSLKSSKHRF